ncbi:MAG: BON domain-containing protein [Acidobacteriota bacterium]|nr:BON domain-containing protein [Acidobacteriota bacterium]
MNHETHTNHTSTRNAWERTGEDVLALTTGIGVGAGLMYLYGPGRARARRRRLIAQAFRFLRHDAKSLEKRGADLLNRARGVAAEVASAFTASEHVPDETLAQRVRSGLGHILSGSESVEVSVSAGIVTLQGRLSHARKRQIQREVTAIPGVHRIIDRIRPNFVLGPGLIAGLAAGVALLSTSSIAGTLARPARR